MTPEEWQEVEAMEYIQPIGHAERMLGYIAHGLSVFFGCKEEPEVMQEAFLPWLDAESNVPRLTPEQIRQHMTRMGL